MNWDISSIIIISIVIKYECASIKHKSITSIEHKHFIIITA